MQADRFTIKSQEALATAGRLGAGAPQPAGHAGAPARRRCSSPPARRGTGAASADAPGGVVLPVLAKLGVEVDGAARRRRAGARRAARRRRRLARATRSRSPALSCWRCCAPPRREAGKLSDQYVSTEHLLLALAAEHGRAADELRRVGVTRERLLQALAEVRGSHRVTDQSPEEKYQALERFGTRPDTGRRAGQARPGDRPRRGDPPRDPGALAPHQEQPRADRRAGRRQDGDRRGPGPADRLRRRARVAARPARDRARHRRADRRREVPRRVRGAPEGGARARCPRRRAA